MEEMQLALTSARIDQKNFGLWLRNWQVGQMLNALVTAQRPTGDIVLRIAGQQITARADIPVQQGTNLLLEVKQLHPQVVLKILPPATQGSASATTNSAPGVAGSQSTGGLLRLLSADGAQPATRNIADIANTLRVLRTVLATGSDNPAQRLLVSLPGMTALLNGPGLRRAIASSGSFLEASLAGAPAHAASPGDVAESDVKAQLMRILEQVKTALQRSGGERTADTKAAFLVDARRDLEAAIGSITVNQLQSQPSDSPASRVWLFDVPFILDDGIRNLQVRVDREGDGNYSDDASDTMPRWRVELHLDLPRLGALQLTTHLRAEVVSVELCAKESRTRELLQTRADELAAALDGLGLEVPSLRVTQWRRDDLDAAAMQSPAHTGSANSWRA